MATGRGPKDTKKTQTKNPQTFLSEGFFGTLTEAQPSKGFLSLHPAGRTVQHARGPASAIVHQLDRGKEVRRDETANHGHPGAADTAPGCDRQDSRSVE